MAKCGQVSKAGARPHPGAAPDFNGVRIAFLSRQEEVPGGRMRVRREYEAPRMSRTLFRRYAPPRTRSRAVPSPNDRRSSLTHRNALPLMKPQSTDKRQ